MSLNIKNEKAHRLASEIARTTGESLTDAVTVALEERLERLRAEDEARKQRIRGEVEAIVARVKKNLVGPPIDHAELLYDERGLPK